jgi:hypothetical protein
VRTGRQEDVGPYEGVPEHLWGSLSDWVITVFGDEDDANPFIPYSRKHRGRRLAAAIRVRVKTTASEELTVRLVTKCLVSYIEEEGLLDAVDAVLHFDEATTDEVDALDELLSLGGSVWEVDPLSRRKLVRRADPTATAAFAESSSPDDIASAELREAWSVAYGRNPDASDAWDHSIKAVEAILIPIVTPNNAKATLGIVIKTLNDQGDLWRLALHGHDRSESVAPLVSMLRLMWPNPDRHGGAGTRKPSLVEAQAVVQLAVTIVQWARSGVLSKKLRRLRGFVLFHHRCRDSAALVDLHPALFGPCAHGGRVGALPLSTYLTRRTGRFARMLDIPAKRAS